MFWDAQIYVSDWFDGQLGAFRFPGWTRKWRWGLERLHFAGLRGSNNLLGKGGLRASCLVLKTPPHLTLLYCLFFGGSLGLVCVCVRALFGARRMLLLFSLLFPKGFGALVLFISLQIGGCWCSCCCFASMFWTQTFSKPKKKCICETGTAPKDFSFWMRSVKNSTLFVKGGAGKYVTDHPSPIVQRPALRWAPWSQTTPEKLGKHIGVKQKTKMAKNKKCQEFLNWPSKS